MYEFCTKLNCVEYCDGSFVFNWIAETLNVEIEVFVSETNKFGKHIGKNGSYNTHIGKIEVDLYAGKDGKGTILYTLAHELTHNIRVSSPEIYIKLSDFLVKEYEEQGKSVEDAIAYYENTYKYSHDVAHEEWVADSMEPMFVRAFEGDTKELNTLKQKCYNVWLKIRELFTKLARVICEEYKGLNPDSEAGRFVANLSDDTFNVLKEMYFEGLGAIAQQREHFSGLEELVEFIDKHNISREDTYLENYKTKNTANNDGVKKSERIKINMSDKERYEILKNRKIEVVEINQYNFSKVVQETPKLLEQRLKVSEARKLLRKIAEEFNVYKNYSNSDIEVEFEFGRNNLNESVSKQKGDYDLFAQMLSCFSDVVANAVGIEIHNRNSKGYKPDVTLKNVYVLFGAFENATDVVPVKLEVKEFYDKPNRLYVAVALNGIKKDRVVSMGVPNDRSHVRTSPVTYSIRDLFKEINPKDVDFIKYLPDEFLKEEQLNTKREYLDKHNSEKTDIRYQARPDFEDIIFDDFDGEVTDNDTRLMTEYFKDSNVVFM